MPGQELDVEILHHIFDQFSGDVTKDCSTIIKNLLKPLSESTLNKASNHEKSFASVNVLLSLYEKLHSSNTGIKSELPVNVILQSIKHVLDCSTEICNLPDNDVQCSILSVVSSVFKNVIMQNSEKNLEELTEFYSYALQCLDIAKECKSDCLIFKLKIMNSIYYALTHVTNTSKDEFIKKIKSINNLDEHKIFANLVLHQNDSIAIQTLMYLIPEHINCFKSDKIVEITWKHISGTVTTSSNKYFRVLIALCHFFDICFDKFKVKDKTDVTVLLLVDANYWEFVQSALVDKDPVKRKQGMFLLKKTVDFLNDTDRNFVCHAEETVFYWHSDCKDELQRIYNEVIICLEFLEEQQVHIIKPVLKMIETLAKEIIKCGRVNFSWILLLYKKALMHESTQIIKWGLNNLLKLPENFFSHEYIARETVGLLVDTLNNMSLYYSNGLVLSRDLSDFFARITKLNTSKLFFCLFIKQICVRVWSAEALFFVIHSLSGIQEFPSWGEEEISEIGTFVSKAFKTHNKIIRTGIRCELLNAIRSLTDKGQVPLESLILSVSKFCMRELVNEGGRAWDDFTNWLRKSYSKQEAENVLERYKRKALGENFNEKFFSLMLVLFDCVFYSDIQNSFSLNCLYDILLSFRDIEKRPYCDKSLYDRYLSVVCNVYETNLSGSSTRLIKPTLPFAKDLLLYIQTQLREISDLQDLDAGESYLNSFQIIIKTLTLYQIDSEIVSDLCETILKELEVCLPSNLASPPIGIYWKMKILSIILEVCVLQPKPGFLVSYLLNGVNEPLERGGNDSKTTRDLQTLWGRMNSQFIEGKWKILEHLIRNELIIHGPSIVEGTCRMGDDGLVKLCIEALDSGGYGVLCPVMSILKNLLPALEDRREVKWVVDSVWKLIMERRKTEEFKLFIRRFVEMLYQEVFVSKGEPAILFEYADFIFADSSTAVVNIFMKHIQQINLLNCSAPRLFCHVVGKGLIFGQVQKKDERLTNEVCCHVESLNISRVGKIGDFNTCNEVRARAVQMILTLDKTSQEHKTVAESLIGILLKTENEMNKNRIRYFGNSHVHRVKHRLLQSLLLLEPLLDPNEDPAKELSCWLYNCLMTENSQPSVRYQQEWLLVRMLLRRSDPDYQYCICNYYNEFGESNKRGLCSAIAVSYHLCKSSSFDLSEERIVREMNEIFSFCFHQHFEVRLYAQVVFQKLYDFAETKKLTKVIEKFDYINRSLRKIFERHLKGNFGKNLEKMLDDFYFTQFNPVEHYSVETIFKDLPRLTNVDSDEWISIKTFECCGVHSTKIGIPLENGEPFFKYFSNEVKWLMKGRNSSEMTAFEGERLENYQKKIIPKKPLIPGWDENDVGQNDDVKKDGLIVVASLIDRIPNLGGLARTCEIFGASEYVVNSLKCIEDKQFTSLSVTAEKWITMKEVKTQNLLDYIFEMKLKGYTVIGAEQMLHSIPLSSAKFPKKSLLLLGNEKEGIPPNLLSLLDICIEIPQLGIIRSLNVHVTGALFIWEYAKQNNFL